MRKEKKKLKFGDVIKSANGKTEYIYIGREGTNIMGESISNNSATVLYTCTKNNSCNIKKIN